MCEWWIVRNVFFIYLFVKIHSKPNRLIDLQLNICCILIIAIVFWCKSIKQYRFLLKRRSEWSYAISARHIFTGWKKEYSHRNENKYCIERRRKKNTYTHSRCEPCYLYTAYWNKTRPLFFPVRVHILAAYIHEHRHQRIQFDRLIFWVHACFDATLTPLNYIQFCFFFFRVLCVCRLFFPFTFVIHPNSS